MAEEAEMALLCLENPLKNPISKNTEESFLVEIWQNFNNFRLSAFQKENYWKKISIDSLV